MTDENPMEGMEKQKVEYKNLKFGKEGDWFRGTLIDNSRQMKNNLSERGEMQTIYEFMAKGGSFHDIVNRVVAEAPTVPEVNDVWSYITGKPALVNQLKKAQLGSIVGFRFSETKKAKTPGHNDAKIIEVFIGDLDPEYQGQTSGDM